MVIITDLQKSVSSWFQPQCYFMCDWFFHLDYNASACTNQKLFSLTQLWSSVQQIKQKLKKNSLQWFMSQNKYQPTNSCTRTPNINQIISYAIVMAVTTVFIVCIQPNLTDYNSRITLITLFFFSLLILIISGSVTSKIDPADPVMFQFLNGDRSKLAQTLHSCLYCDTCNSYVLPTSRHCKICNRYMIYYSRCVDIFDHHCIWINNCIGEPNYRSFMVMLFSAISFLLIFLASAGVLWKQHDWNNYAKDMIVIWIFSIITIFAQIMLGALTGLHLYLLSKGLTTFQFIMNKRSDQMPQFQSNNRIHNNHNHIQETIDQFKNKKIQVGMEQVVFQNHPPQDRTSEEAQSKRSDDSKWKQQQTIQKKGGTVPVQVIDQENQELNMFYRRNKSLKLLIGDGVLVKPIPEKTQKIYFSNKSIHNQFIDKNQPKQYSSILQVQITPLKK